MNPAPRLSALRDILAEQGVQALVVASPANVVYLTGFDSVFDEERSSVCLVTDEIARVYVDSRYVEAAKTASDSGPWTVSGPESDVWEAALADVDAEHYEAVAVEDSVPYSRFEKVSAGREARIRSADSWVERIRLVKDAAELERIQAAADITDHAFDHIIDIIGAGMTEAQVVLELETFMRRNGSEGVAFPSIVASGLNGSRPHAKAGERVLEPGDLVTMDFGARVGGYCADMTRTIGIGAVDGERRAVYAVVLAANEAGRQAARAGLTGAEIDAEARRVINDAGFGAAFGHGLGHGVGLEVHEGPSVSPRGEKQIPAGAVVTIEPGVYVPGLGGVRIEDLVVVREDSSEPMSHSPRHLIEI